MIFSYYPHKKTYRLLHAMGGVGFHRYPCFFFESLRPSRELAGFFRPVVIICKQVYFPAQWLPFESRHILYRTRRCSSCPTTGAERSILLLWYLLGTLVVCLVYCTLLHLRVLSLCKEVATGMTGGLLSRYQATHLFAKQWLFFIKLGLRGSIATGTPPKQCTVVAVVAAAHSPTNVFLLLPGLDRMFAPQRRC